MEEIKNIIYHTTNKERKCFYVGYSTEGLKKRKKRHEYSCFIKKQTYKLYNFIRKYGWDSFDWEILAVYSTPEELPPAEINWIAEQKKEYSDWVCLNSTEGGFGLANPSKETRKKISESRIGEKNPFYGKRHTEKEIERRKKAMSGKNNPYFGKGYLQIGEKNPWFGKGYLQTGENNGFYGKHHSEKTREKMRLAWKQRKLRSK